MKEEIRLPKDMPEDLKEEAVEFLQTINREIAKWIKESREMESPNIDVKCLCGKNLVGSQSSPITKGEKKDAE